jgi:hypothetical protein
MHHPVDGQILDRYDVEPMDELPALLVTEVGAPIGNTLMHASHDLATFRPFWCALLRYRELALRPVVRNYWISLL